MVEKSENIIVNADNPDTHLVSFKMDGTNFNIWCIQFTIVVTSKNKLDFLTGDKDEPSHPTSF